MVILSHTLFIIAIRPIDARPASQPSRPSIHRFVHSVPAQVVAVMRFYVFAPQPLLTGRDLSLWSLAVCDFISFNLHHKTDVIVIAIAIVMCWVLKTIRRRPSALPCMEDGGLARREELISAWDTQKWLLALNASVPPCVLPVAFLFQDDELWLFPIVVVVVVASTKDRSTWSAICQPETTTTTTWEQTREQPRCFPDRFPDRD